MTGRWNGGIYNWLVHFISVTGDRCGSANKRLCDSSRRKNGTFGSKCLFKVHDSNKDNRVAALDSSIPNIVLVYFCLDVLFLSTFPPILMPGRSDLGPKWFRLAVQRDKSNSFSDHTSVYFSSASTEIWSEKVPNWSYLRLIWPILEPNLTSLAMTQCYTCRAKCTEIWSEKVPNLSHLRPIWHLWYIVTSSLCFFQEKLRI